MRADRGVPRLSFWVAAEPGAYALLVADDGVGLGKSAVTGGSGMGSRFVDAFVRQLGGSVATAAGEKGTTFTVRLPTSVLT